MNSSESQSPTYSVLTDFGFLRMLEYIAENPDTINQMYAGWILHEMAKCNIVVTREFQNALFQLGFVSPAMLGLVIPQESDIIEEREEEDG